MSEIKKFIEWLAFRPTPEEIARVLTTEHLLALGVCRIRLGRINNDDSAVVLGQYGYVNADHCLDVVVPGSEWRLWDSPDIDIITGRNPQRWSPDSKMCVVMLRDRGVMQGNTLVEFSKPVEESQKHHVLEAIEDFCVPIALYLSFQNRAEASKVVGIRAINGSRDAGADQLSARQLSILRGMVEGKTNHELATEMGFSVSTIRHETMRIYQALAVSDRKEAAKKALMLSII